MRVQLILGVMTSLLLAAAPATAPVVITVDTSEAPQLAAFGNTVQAVASEWYPKIAAALPSDGFTPPARIAIVFPKDFKGVANCSGDRIRASIDWFTRNPDDVGAFVHELTHAVQHYTKGDRPGWLTEGIADYVRFYLYEPESKRPHPNPAKSKYSDSYRTTAHFLNWAQTTYDPKLVEKLNAACREARYSDALWTQSTGKNLEELGEEWKKSLVAGGK